MGLVHVMTTEQTPSSDEEEELKALVNMFTLSIDLHDISNFTVKWHESSSDLCVWFVG